MENNNLIEIGKVIKPHGLKGEVVFDAFVDDLSDFENVSTFFLFPSNGGVDAKADGVVDSYKLEYIKPFKNVSLLKLIGVNRLEEAEKLRNIILSVEKNELPEDETAVYLRDLVGKLVYEHDRYIGEVIGYYETSGTILEVKLDNGKQVDIPYVFVLKADERKLYVKLIEGIID